ncbi:MAG: DUF4142 domain-containing protein [Bacteroidota bacterium]
MKKVLMLFIAGSFCIAGTTAQTTTKTGMSTTTDNDKIKDDVKFAKKAAECGLLEVQLGKLAQTNANSQDVKMHAQHMIDDHTKLNEELKTIAQKKNIVLATSITEKQQMKYDDMAKLKGKEFDSKFTEFMIEDHKDAIKMFKEEAKDGKDAELKAFASGKISTLEHHLEMWEGASKVVTK